MILWFNRSFSNDRLEGEKLEKSSARLAQSQFDLEEERNKLGYHKQTWTGDDDLRVMEQPRFAVAEEPRYAVAVEVIAVEESIDDSLDLLEEDVVEEDKENTAVEPSSVDKEDTAVIEKALNNSKSIGKVVNIDRTKVKKVNECNQQ